MKICSQNPIWNFTTKLIVDEATPQNLLLEVFDADLGKVETVFCLAATSSCFPSGRPTWQLSYYSYSYYLIIGRPTWQGDDRCAKHCRAQAALWPVDTATGKILHNNRRVSLNSNNRFQGCKSGEVLLAASFRPLGSQTLVEAPVTVEQVQKWSKSQINESESLFFVKLLETFS